MRFKDYSTKENIIVFGIIILVLFLTSLPPIVGAFLTQGDVFLGGNHLNQGDLHVYKSYIEQIKVGKILVANNFTSEPQSNILFTPLWLLLGFISKVFMLNTLLIYHIARVVAGFIFLVFLFYYFLDLFFTKYLNKLISFILICFSSGMGLFFMPKVEGIVTDDKEIFKDFAADLVMAEANVFLSLAHSALFILSQLIILLLFYFFLKEGYKKFEMIYVFLLGLTLGFLHTYDIIIVGGVLTVYLFVLLVLSKFKMIKVVWFLYLQKYIVILMSFLPALAYFYFILKPDPTIWGWIEQNKLLSPALSGYLLAFSPLIIFSIISLYLLRKRILNKKIIFLLCWIISIFILVYLPFDWQRKLITTVSIALAILATYGARFLILKILKIYNTKILNYIALFVIFIFIDVSNISFITTSIYDYQRYHNIFYLSSNCFEAAKWYKDNIDSEQAILSEVLNSASIAGITGKSVFVGHPHQTINYLDKRAQLSVWFYDKTMKDDDRKEFLEKNNIGFIFDSPKERSLSGLDLKNKDWLEEIYNKDDVQIYKIIY